MGHWNYILAAYLATAIGLGGYWLSVKRRIRQRMDILRMTGGGQG